MNKSEKQWWQKNFPTAAARDAADRAIDALPVDRPMTEFIDVWIAAYIKAGGRRPQR